MPLFGAIVSVKASAISQHTCRWRFYNINSPGKPGLFPSCTTLYTLLLGAIPHEANCWASCTSRLPCLLVPCSQYVLTRDTLSLQPDGRRDKVFPKTRDPNLWWRHPIRLWSQIHGRISSTAWTKKIKHPITLRVQARPAHSFYSWQITFCMSNSVPKLPPEYTYRRLVSTSRKNSFFGGRIIIPRRNWILKGDVMCSCSEC